MKCMVQQVLNNDGISERFGYYTDYKFLKGIVLHYDGTLVYEDERARLYKSIGSLATMSILAANRLNVEIHIPEHATPLTKINPSLHVGETIGQLFYVYNRLDTMGQERLQEAFDNLFSAINYLALSYEVALKDCVFDVLEQFKDEE